MQLSLFTEQQGWKSCLRKEKIRIISSLQTTNKTHTWPDFSILSHISVSGLLSLPAQWISRQYQYLILWILPYILHMHFCVLYLSDIVLSDVFLLPSQSKLKQMYKQSLVWSYYLIWSDLILCFKFVIVQLFIDATTWFDRNSNISLSIILNHPFYQRGWFRLNRFLGVTISCVSWYIFTFIL